MRRYPVGLGLFAVGILAGCGSSDGGKGSGGTGGFGFFDAGSGGGSDQTGGLFGGNGGSNDGSGGLTFGNGGGLTFGGFPGTGGSGTGGATGGVGGTSTDGGGLDGSASDASTGGSVASGGSVGNGGSTGNGGAIGNGGSTGNGGAVGTGGTKPDEDSGTVPDCGDHVREGSEACDTGGDSKTCDADCTLPVCGDGHLNTAAGEQCDDHNTVRGDGCGPTCQFENKCGAAVPIVLSGQGTLTGSASGDTTDAISRVHDAVCDGTDVGQGPDELYSFTLDRTRSVNLSLNANFNGILRAYTTACDPTAPLDEAGGDACANAGGGTESMSFRNLGAGTYYVVVDGAAAGDKGTYGLNVSAVCNGIDQVRIVELGIGTTDYLVLRNMSDCPADVTGAKVLFNDSVAEDLTTTLPSLILQPGEQLRIQENLGSSVPGAIDAGGDIAFEYDRGGTALFCKDDCSVAANVLDAISFADGDPSTLDPPPALPSPAKFQFPVTGITAANQDTKSWVRVGTSGKYPSFTGGDWCTGTPNVPFGLRLDEVFVGDPDFVAIKNHADCAVGIQPFQVRLSTEGVTTPIDAILDSRLLASGAAVYLSEPPNKSNDVNTGVNIPNTGALAGSVRLCLGSCKTAGTTIDAVGWNGASSTFAAFPDSITFTPDGLSTITLANQQTESYLRAALKGNDSRFVAADWKTGTASR